MCLFLLAASFRPTAFNLTMAVAPVLERFSSLSVAGWSLKSDAQYSKGAKLPCLVRPLSLSVSLKKKTPQNQKARSTFVLSSFPFQSLFITRLQLPAILITLNLSHYLAGSRTPLHSFLHLSPSFLSPYWLAPSLHLAILSTSRYSVCVTL